MRLALLVLALSAAPAVAQLSPDLIEVARICQDKFVKGPHQVRPDSFFVEGFEGCDKIMAECSKIAPNCIAKDDAAKAEAVKKDQLNRVNSVSEKLKK
jgi:hypothetical protein